MKNVILLLTAVAVITMTIPIICAQENPQVCCEKTLNGNYCQDIEEAECNSSYSAPIPTQCEYVDYCKKGCCYSTKTGACNKATPDILCEGDWKEDGNCNIPECSRGCCVIGRNALFTTERNCEVKSSFFGLAKDFRPEVKNEIDCIFLTEKEDEGACIYGENCRLTTRESCKSTGGEFYKGKYCSDPSLNTTCKAKDRAGCFEQKVYWFDSCGNREAVKEKCDIFEGTMCGLVGTEYKCKSIDCEVTIGGKKVTKKNGESWCEYEGAVGTGLDTVGSRHIRHLCSMGEERIEPCQDYRNRACIQSNIVIKNETQKTRNFSEARCVVNSWLQCLDYNKETDLTKLRNICSNDSLCFMKSVYVDDYFQFAYCSPMFPPGFDIKSEDKKKNGEDICAIATQRCTIIYVKGWNLKWKCKENCECETVAFTEQMNSLCASLGDCGAYVNVVGDITDEGYTVSRAPRISNSSLKVLKAYAKPIEDKMMDTLGEFLEIGGGGAEILNAITQLKQLGLINDDQYFGYTTTITNLATLAEDAKKAAGKKYEGSIEYWIMGGPLAKAIFGIGKTKKKYATFTCMPWQPPLGGANCEKCSNFTSCSEYRCINLGQTCALLNKGTEFEACVNNASSDVSSPRITPLYGTMTEGFEYRNIRNEGFEIKEAGRDCIPEFTNVLFGIQTDKPAQCVIGNDSIQTFDEMKDHYFGGRNLFLTNHTTYLSFPSAEALENEYEDLAPVEISKLGETNIYVKCRGVNGKENDAAYFIKSCVKEGPTYPYITRASPENGGYIAYNADEINATFWVNEPSECRYSSEDKEYESMENLMECQDSLENYGLDGLACNTTLNVSSNTQFYVRCKDKSEYNMTMEDSYPYELQRSASELRIILIDPENGEVIRVASEPATVNLEVVTGGGAEDGKATCYYKFAENALPIRFRETDSNKHKQVFSSILGGNYKIWVECEDVAENKAAGTTEFTVYVDTNAPSVTRVYYSNGLKIATNEDSTCAYSFIDSRCSFDIKNITEKNNAELMTGTGKEHTTEWQAEQTYYIKCMDEYGNQPGRCSIVVRPYEIMKKTGT